MKEKKASAAERNVWTGAVSFGLVQIPVGLRSATVEHELHFHMLDRRNMSPIHNERLNKKTGKPVAWKDLVKGYEIKRGSYVVMSDAEIKLANAKSSETLEIIEFVEGAEIDPIYYDKPYFLVPLKGGAKAYALLRECLRQSGQVGIAKLVIRTRQHLAALRVYEDALVVNLLRFVHELRSTAELELPAGKGAAASKQELAMAARLVQGMKTTWKPEKFHDEFRDDLLTLIEKKSRRGDQQEVEAPIAEKAPRGKVIDLMEQLRRSIGDGGAPKAKKAVKKRAG